MIREERGKSEQRIMELAFDKFNFTVRGYHKVLKTARTIADMEESERISIRHLSEAVSYRSMEWGDYGR